MPGHGSVGVASATGMACYSLLNSRHMREARSERLNDVLVMTIGTAIGSDADRGGGRREGGGTKGGRSRRSMRGINNSFQISFWRDQIATNQINQWRKFLPFLWPPDRQESTGYHWNRKAITVPILIHGTWFQAMSLSSNPMLRCIDFKGEILRTFF